MKAASISSCGTTCRAATAWLVRCARRRNWMPVLEILRAQGVIARAPAPTPTGPIADEPSRYDAHMSSARGLAAGTRRGRLRIKRSTARTFCACEYFGRRT